MDYQKFGLQALTTMDGGVLREAVDHLISRALHDCEDRPRTKDARRIQVAILLTPVVDASGELDTINVDFDFGERIPVRRSKTYNMKPVPGGLLFNDFSPGDVRQGTLEGHLKKVGNEQ